MTLDQVILPPSVTTSGGSADALSGLTGLSVHALRRQQARDDLVHLLSVASLTDIPTIAKAGVVPIYWITRLCTFCNRDPIWGGVNHRYTRSITALYETTTHTDTYCQLAFHKLASIKFFDKKPNDDIISIVFKKFMATLREYEYAGQTT